MQASTFTVDVSDRHQIYATAKRVLSEIGSVDILVNNAGLCSGKRLVEIPDENIEKMLKVNTASQLFVSLCLVV